MWVGRQGQAAERVVEALADHDDLLIGALNDLLVFAVGVRGTGGSGCGESPRPQALFAAFLRSVGTDDAVVLDFLLSSEVGGRGFVVEYTTGLPVRKVAELTSTHICGGRPLSCQTCTLEYITRCVSSNALASSSG